MIYKSPKPPFCLFLLAGCIVALTISLAPLQDVRADTSSSDLAIRLVSAPKHVKACQVFQMTFEIANLGPDVATGIIVSETAPDPLGAYDILGVPAMLAPGETAIVTATVKVVAFVPDEIRASWVGAHIFSSPYPDTSVDPKPDNDYAIQDLRFIGKPQYGCP
jgi:hypothetical protein